MPPSPPAFTVVMDLSTILDVTDEHSHLTRLFNTRIDQAGGVWEDELDAFVFAILDDLEGRLTAGLTAAGLKETVSRVIDEMLEEDQAAVSYGGGKTRVPLTPDGEVDILHSEKREDDLESR
ncbi:hypothetical protein [uncultured Methanofollis sp.]|uniref:hypothetical protein n=1 Tax=uncultured Methanofollis sp. TaxID=262500 RepID=UPI00260574E9|nr:hypothetical protein [uncultured Methanofollis sp.]